MATHTVILHGVKLELTSASSIPGPDVKGGMATSDIKTWYRIDGGPWWLPNHTYDGLGDKAFWDSLNEAQDAKQVLVLLSFIKGREQFS